MADNKYKKSGPEPSKWYSVPFFVTLAVITVISFIIPMRPTRSNSEKRDLAKFPEFSVEALSSGTYFEDITLWFSDTFPGREDWLTIASYSDSFYGYSEIMIEGEIQLSETVPLVVPEYTAPPEEPEDTDAAQTPEEETEVPEETEETVPEETEPEGWGGIDAGDEAEILRSATAIQIGDAVFFAQGFSQVVSDRYIKVINDFAKEMEEKGVVVIHAPAPTAVGVLIEEDFMAKLNCVSQVAILNYMHSGISDSVVKVDTVNALIEHNDEYIYFRTDHHWTALGAYYSYVAVCESLDMTPVDINDLEVWDQGTFKGSMYGRASRPHMLTLDTVYAYVPEGNITNHSLGSGFSEYEIPVLQDCTDREENAKYLVFGTDYPMNRMTNHSIPDAPNILVVKDSFGNCFVPFLTQNFHNVYAVDYRKYRSMTITQLVDELDIDYVLFMPYVTATQSTDGPSMLRKLCLTY